MKKVTITVEYEFEIPDSMEDKSVDGVTNSLNILYDYYGKGMVDNSGFEYQGTRIVKVDEKDVDICLDGLEF